MKCTACRWYCSIPNGKTGVCGIRENKNGSLYLKTYAKPVAINVDPIEKKPLFHFLPGTDIFSLGTLGCNFACEFCQNWDISQAVRKHHQENPAKTPSDLFDIGHHWPPEKIVDCCVENQIPSIAFTYNEPGIFFEYAFDTMKLGKTHGLKHVFVSNGYTSSEALQKMGNDLNAINIDLKSYSEKFYQKNCHAQLEPVLSCIEEIAKSNTWLEITTLVIPGENDSSNELAQIAEFIASQNPLIPWHVSAFHPDYHMDHVPATPRKTLETAFEIGKKAGLEFVYIGNMESKAQNTVCPHCQTILIQRKGFNISENQLLGDRCPKCDQTIPGIWN